MTSNCVQVLTKGDCVRRSPEVFLPPSPFDVVATKNPIKTHIRVHFVTNRNRKAHLSRSSTKLNLLIDIEQELGVTF